MSMGAWNDTHEQYREVERRLGEMRAAADEARMVRQVRQPRSARHSVGVLLIAAGQWLVGSSGEPRVDRSRQRSYSGVQRY